MYWRPWSAGEQTIRPSNYSRFPADQPNDGDVYTRSTRTARAQHAHQTSRSRLARCTSIVARLLSPLTPVRRAGGPPRLAVRSRPADDAHAISGANTQLAYPGSRSPGCQPLHGNVCEIRPVYCGIQSCRLVVRLYVMYQALLF